ncbi:Lysophospholipid transporter LplT [invertebrate metagenome]|uniref:Lysophospholipid transporter LplT n=1 Tax=invertebrate metagenome TaxID=1711999 RepID=A0A2H9T437_9ZZZZ
MPIKTQQKSQFILLKQRRFLPLFLTQFLGAFNDNVYKNTLLLMVAFSASVQEPIDSRLFINLAAGLFIAPFFLFSFLAGQLADKYDKSQIIRYTKLAEIFIMVLAVPFIVMEHYWVLLFFLFMMGTQSAFFGPVKYAALPEQLAKDELVGGNALVEAGTFIAILGGMFMAGWLIMLGSASLWIAVWVVLLSVFGWLASCCIPKSRAVLPQLSLSWHFFPETIRLIKLIRQDRLIFYATVAISWFWALGAACLTQFPVVVSDVLNGPPYAVSLMLALFILGVGGGALCCEWLTCRETLTRWVPVAAVGLTVACIDTFYNLQNITGEKTVGLISFIQEVGHVRLFIDVVSVGFWGGLFAVPLYALIQQRTPENCRSRGIAALNVMNALFMVLSALLGMLWMGVFAFSLASFFLLLGGLNMVLGIFLFYVKMPEFLQKKKA